MWFVIVGKRTFQHDRAHAVTGREAVTLEEQRLVLARAVRRHELGAGPVLLDPTLVETWPPPSG